MRKVTIARCGVAALAALTLACGGGEEGGANGGETAASLAAQPDRPRVPASAVTLAERYRITPEARAAASLANPSDVAVDAAGSVYVLDAADTTRILKFDSAGGFTLRFGHREPERRRIERATTFALTRWNTIMVLDRGANGLSTFLTVGGTFASSYQLTGVGVRALPRPAFHEVYVHKWDPERRRAYVVHMRTSPFDSVQTTYGIDIPPQRSLREQARDIGFHTAVDRDGRLYVGFEDAYAIRVLEADGTTVRRMGIDREPLAKSPARIAAEREQNLAELREGLEGVRDTVMRIAAEPSPTLPFIEEIAVDPDGRTWVRTSREGVAGTAYDVFDEAGEYLAPVEVPGRVVRTAFAPDGRLFVIEAGDDEEGSRRVVGYEVRIGEPATPEGEPAGPES